MSTVLSPGSAPASLAENIAEPDLPAALAEIAALRRQLAELQVLANIPENNPNPVVRFDAQGRQLFANRSALRLRQDLSLREQVRVRRQLRTVAQAGTAEEEIQIGERYFELSVVTGVGPVGSITLYLTEKTQRVLAQRRLTEQQAFIEQILDTTPSVIFVRDAEANIVFANRAMNELRELIATLGEAPTPPALSQKEQEISQYAETDAQVLATGEQAIIEDPLTLPTGEKRWFYTVKRLLLRPDGTRQVLGISTDITAQKLANQALTEQSKQYRDLMTYSQALICTHDLAGKVLSANPAVAELMGLPLEMLPGRYLREVVPPEHQANLATYLHELATTGLAQRGVMGIILPNAQRRYLLYDNHLVREPGQPPYVIGYGQDITERLLAERELKAAKTAAEAAVLARENFLANMSHEIRTPLNGVLGMTAQLARTQLDARQQEFVRTIRHSGQHLLHVINDVLDMAKITSGKLELEAVAFNLCDSMGEAVRPLALQASEKGLNFSGVPLKTTCNYPWVMGDAHRLNQILINLVGNAIKFTERGGSVRVLGEQLAETATTLTVRFSVEDTGIGIAPDKQGLIFEGFTQAYADTARRFGGTGLGLSISKALVTQLGGELILTSEPGKGSTFAFTITLPKAPAPVPATALDAYDTGALQGRRVLVVEDNEINRTVARLLLEGWGMEVDEAEDGLLGVAKVATEPLYDVVLMDIQMPGLNGMDATAAIRALPDAARAQSPIVALTANAFLADRERYLAAGMVDCLAKPFEEENVYQTLVRVMPPATAYDLTKLRTLARGREAFVVKIVQSFLTNMPGSLAELQAAATAANWSEVAKIVHHIKPSLESLGIRDVAATVQQLENPAPANQAALPAAVAHLTAQVQRALATLPQEVPAG